MKKVRKTPSTGSVGTVAAGPTAAKGESFAENRYTSKPKTKTSLPHRIYTEKRSTSLVSEEKAADLS